MLLLTGTECIQTVWLFLQFYETPLGSFFEPREFRIVAKTPHFSHSSPTAAPVKTAIAATGSGSIYDSVSSGGGGRFSDWPGGYQSRRSRVAAGRGRCERVVIAVRCSSRAT